LVKRFIKNWQEFDKVEDKYYNILTHKI